MIRNRRKVNKRSHIDKIKKIQHHLLHDDDINIDLFTEDVRRGRRKVDIRLKRKNIETIKNIYKIIYDDPDDDIYYTIQMESNFGNIDLLDDAEIVVGYLGCYRILYEDKKDGYISENTIKMFSVIYEELIINLRLYIENILELWQLESSPRKKTFIGEYVIKIYNSYNKLLKCKILQ